MAAPLSGQSSPISYSNNRLVVQGENGVIKQYRLVIRKKGQNVPLTPEQEKKAAIAIQKILTEAGLNKAGVDLSKASLKGRVVRYEGKELEPEKQPSKHTYKEFKDIIDSVKIPAEKAKAPAKEAMKNAAAEPLAKTGETIKAANLTAKETKSESFTDTLLSRIRSITSIFKSNVPDGAKNLETLSAALEKAIASDGKLRLENNALIVTSREIGAPSRKGGKQSAAALTFLLNEVQQTLDKKAISDNEKILIQDILEKLASFPWAQTSFEKNPDALALYQKAKLSWQEKNTVSEHFFTSKDLYDGLTNAKNPETVENFFIGYRVVFNGPKPDEELKAIADNTLRYKEMQAMRSVGMLNFLRDQANASISPNSDGMKEYKELFHLISIWLNDDSFNEKDYLHPDVANTIRSIVKESPFGADALESKNLLTLLEEKLNEKPEVQPLTVKASAPSLKQELEKVKRGELNKEEYRKLVELFVEDLSTLGLVSLKGIGLGEIDISTLATGPGFQDNANYLNNLSNFVTREILTPPDNLDAKKAAKRMLAFFNEVQKELIARDKFDAAVQVQAGMEANPIRRLGLEAVPEEKKARSLTMQTSKEKESLGILYARAKKESFVPHLGLYRGKLNGSNESHPSTRKTPEGVTQYNLFKIFRNAEIKKNVLNIQRSAAPSGELNLDGVKEMFETKITKAQREANLDELYKLSEAIVPKSEGQKAT